MPRILVFQHVAYEILGTLNPLFKEEGFRIRYVNFEREPDAIPDVDAYDGLVILGGPMGVNDSDGYPHLNNEVQAIQKAIEKNIPILGICLGAQLIAKALGGEVRKNIIKEIGWFDIVTTEEGQNDPLLKKFSHQEKICQWHQDTFDLPTGSVHLASSKDCENQAFRFGDKVYGFQFHLEVDQQMIERWLKVPHHKKDLEAMNISVDAIRRSTHEHIQKSMALSLQTFSAFIQLFGSDGKSKRLSSR
jgi:GMP synthase (glutamine-hydrolysing)